MLKNNNNDRSFRGNKEFRDLFHMFDEDNSGEIDEGEFNSMMHILGIQVIIRCNY